MAKQNVKANDQADSETKKDTKSDEQRMYDAYVSGKNVNSIAEEFDLTSIEVMEVIRKAESARSRER